MLRTFAVTVATLLLAAVPAAAQAEEPVYVETPMFFTCQTPTPVHQLVSWGLSPDAPAASFTEGAGCGFADTTLQGANQQTIYDAHAQGTFRGPVKNLVVELHDLLLTQASIADGIPFEVTLSIDGTQVLLGEDVEAWGEISSTGLTQKLRFTIDVEALGLTADVDRDFLLTIDQRYLDTAAIWVAGAKEVPAGILFNRAKSFGPVLKAR